MSIEESLAEKALSLVKSSRGFRKPTVENIFRRVALITPDEVYVSNYRRRPMAIFNPGAMLMGDSLYILPRMIFDYYNYTSSIGVMRVDVNDVVGGKLPSKLEARIILWPRELWEFRGCEDPRIFRHGDGILMLYTGWGYYLEGDSLKPRAVLSLAQLDEGFSVLKRGFFKIVSRIGEVFIPSFNKDSAFLRVNGDDALMVTRPNVKGIEVGWVTQANLGDLTMAFESMRPILWFEDFEFKVGWSTNTVKLSSNEYLVGWHGVLRSDYSYADGLALLDDEGRLLALSNYLLAPSGIEEEYGDRPRVIFGDGLVLYKDLLIWVGGVSDYAIGIYVVELDKALEKLRRVYGAVNV